MLLVPLGSLNPREYHASLGKVAIFFAERFMALRLNITQIANKTCLPVINIVLADRYPSFPHDGNTLRQRHRQSTVERVRHIIPVGGLTMSAEVFVRGSRKLKAPAPPRIGRICAATYSLCHGVHPVAQRCYEADVGTAEHLHQDLTVKVLVQIKQRRPAQLTVAPVDAPCFRLQLMTNILIGLHFPTRRRCNLRIADFTVVLRIFIQQRFIRQEALGSPLSSRDAPPRRYSSCFSSFCCASFGGGNGPDACSAISSGSIPIG